MKTRMYSTPFILNGKLDEIRRDTAKREAEKISYLKVHAVNPNFHFDDSDDWELVKHVLENGDNWTQTAKAMIPKLSQFLKNRYENLLDWADKLCTDDSSHNFSKMEKDSSKLYWDFLACLHGIKQCKSLEKQKVTFANQKYPNLRLKRKFCFRKMSWQKATKKKEIKKTKDIANSKISSFFTNHKR